MKVIILAAGKGKRLAPHTNNTPKSLVEINGKPWIEYTLSTLNEKGLTDVIIVVGYLHNKYISEIGNTYKNVKITYVINNDYLTTDNMDSLWLTHDLFDDDVLIFNADVLFNKRILDLILNEREENITVVEKSNKLTASSMQVKISDGKVKNFERGIVDGDGRAIGMHKFSHSGAKKYFAEVAKLVKENKPHILEDAFLPFIKINDLNVVYSNGIPWIEIDDANDLNEAKENIKEICSK